MKVVVKSYALLGRTIGQGQIVVELEEGASLRDLLKRISQQYGVQLEEHLLADDGELSSNVLISHNGAQLKSVDTPLSEGDLVLLLQPLGGG